MRKTNNERTGWKMAADTKELQSVLSCGRDTAVRIGTEAKARIQIGKRVLWNMEKIQAYINKLSEGA